MKIKCVVSEERLKELCREWQARLHLQAWDIVVKICRQSEFALPDVEGENLWDLRVCKSFIRILDPIDYKSSSWPQDMEICLVHELLHLHFMSFEPKDDGLEHDYMESVIERLANVLVDMKRETGKGGDGINDGTDSAVAGRKVEDSAMDS